MANNNNALWKAEECVKAMKELLAKMEEAFPKNGTEEEWEAFESIPITIGFGDTSFTFETHAQTYNFLYYGIDDYLKEMDDDFESD